jgi:hypothetical protein
MITKASLNGMLAARGQISFAANSLQAPAGVQFDDVVGFHSYGDLSLHLRLAAAQDVRNADKYLDILEEYAQIAEACCLQAGVRLLEVQGERLHFFQLAPVVDDTSVKQLLQFSVALTQTIYDRLRVKAGTDWNGFAMAADHGRAIVIATGRDGDDSVVSLGDPANRPAKRLARTPAVKSGHLALRTVLTAKSPLLIAGGAYRHDAIWVEIPVNEPPHYLENIVNFALKNQMLVTASAIANSRTERTRRPTVKSITANDVAEHATIDDPIEVQALCVRADLDGFSQQVQEAFAAGTEQAIRALIERFLVIMEYPDEFQKRVNRKVISLPWAGDCATLILLLGVGESWETLKKTVPATAAMLWHDSDGTLDGRMREIRNAMAGTRWSVGVAGGDTEEGASGKMLVANIQTTSRKFRVASGWNVRRSLDAQQAENVAADDTVVPVTDYNGLNSDYQLAFKDLPSSSIFKRATLTGLKKARQNQVEAISKHSAVVLPNIIRGTIPTPKPYAT